MVKIICISDTHRMHGLMDLPDGDILLHAGDFTDWGAFNDIRDFGGWLRSQTHKHKVIIAGNHDVKFEHYPEEAKFCLLQKKNIHYLDNETIELEGLKIFGCPWTPRFGGAFQLDLDEKEDKEFWEKTIPKDIDILVTHGPPYGILDSNGGYNCGSQGLLNRVLDVKPKLHLFGHIHESYGIIKQRYGITFVNAAALNFKYNDLNKPIEVEI